MNSPYSINIPQDCLQSLIGESEGRVNLIIMYQRYILCSNRRESEDQCKGDPSSLSLPSILCHICGTKPSIKPLTTDRFKKPLPFSFVRVMSALYRKNQSRNYTITRFLHDLKIYLLYRNNNNSKIKISYFPLKYTNS